MKKIIKRSHHNFPRLSTSRFFPGLSISVQFRPAVATFEEALQLKSPRLPSAFADRELSATVLPTTAFPFPCRARKMQPLINAGCYGKRSAGHADMVGAVAAATLKYARARARLHPGRLPLNR